MTWTDLPMPWLLPEREWQEYGACRETDPEAFYPLEGESTAPAKQVCAGCEVREECLEYALANRETHGVWGGLSDRQRRKLWRAAPDEQAAA